MKAVGCKLGILKKILNIYIRPAYYLPLDIYGSVTGIHDSNFVELLHQLHNMNTGIYSMADDYEFSIWPYREPILLFLEGHY